ncbi:MAG TPA: hypothetical protein VJU61_08185 [Polyangiaceae bacterium]|nr:hypothetical protein [Polyangiaceae bacterium]
MAFFYAVLRRPNVPMPSSPVFPSDRVFTEFCDRDSNWGPLLFLRPAQRERIGVARTAAGAVLLGLPFGLLATILLTLCARVLLRPAPGLLEFPLLLTLGYWLVAQLTLARAWNRRAARLARWT